MTAENASSGHTRSDPQPCCGTHVSASSSGTTVAISKPKPLQSIRLSDGRGFMYGNSRCSASRAMMPTGRFT
ncbi:hypothetical protein D3C83_173890 [compost metagenome]